VPDIPTPDDQPPIEPIPEEHVPAEERWTPPESVFVRTADPDLARAIRRYLRSLPEAHEIDAPTTDAGEIIARSLDRSRSGAPAGPRRTVRWTVDFEEERGLRGWYGVATVTVSVDSGAIGRSPGTQISVFGPSVFSPVSGYDACMNSLLRIDRETRMLAFSTATREIEERATHVGLEYVVTGTRTEEIDAVLRSVALPTDTETRWFAILPPDDLEGALARNLDGSSFEARVNERTRTVTFSSEDSSR
jgi:hypothetical protein